MLKQKTKEAISEHLAEAVCSVANQDTPLRLAGDTHWRAILYSGLDPRQPNRVELHLEYCEIVPGQDTTGWIPLEDT